MTHILPFPLISTFLFVTWLLLNQSVSAGHVVLGALLAVIGGRIVTAAEPPKFRVRRVGAILRLAGLVLIDILVSNIAVARTILGISRPSTSGFDRTAMDLRSPYGLAALAIIVTSTPGTAWVDFDSSSRMLTIHVLDLEDERTRVRSIKYRYERLLQEIFE